VEAVMLWVALVIVVVIGCVAAGARWHRRRVITIDPISEKHTAEMRKDHNP
jgi:cytochrome c-type biogenesis protein CcmH/NrfF